MSMVNLCLLLKVLFKNHKLKEMHLGHCLFQIFWSIEAYGILGIIVQVIKGFLFSMMAQK